ncbi:uncharacterized protein LOC129890509 [Solanum dulcamara]|uniref:uncharacterized protein LOC129890509 n=1 Tax=Solanum dulcamara TaxID=45834 RepID=UPI002486127F|nr:uncharacterized protein LOC129890509 [Solanum dulcamara]
MVADVLNHKSMGSLVEVQPERKEMIREIFQLARLRVRLADSGDDGVSIRGIAESSIMEEEIEIPTWKWEVINMDFITGLPHTPRTKDFIWVIMDRLTKSAHFLPVRTTYSTENYAKLYVKEIVQLYGVPTSIISDRGAQFIAHFWRSLQEVLGTQVSLSTAFHPQTDGYHSNIQMAPYEALYDRKCRSPIGWFDVGEIQLMGPDIVQQAVEKVTKELAYEEQPIAILDQKIRRFRTKNVASVKVLWQNRNQEKMTWEDEEDMRHRYPYLFPISTGNPDS